MTDKPDPNLAAALKRLDETREALRRDLAEGLRRGGAAIASQVNEVLSTTNDRLARLERKTKK